MSIAASKAHLVHVGSLSGQAPSLCPASHTKRPLEGAACCLAFLSPFGHRHSLLGPSCPPGELGLPYSWLTGPTPGPRRGFPRSARSRPDRGGCSLYPGATVFTRPAPSHRPPLPHLSGQPCPRRYIPSPRVSMSRHQREFTCVHSSGLPLACSPRTGVWRDFRVIPGRWHRAGKVFPLRVR